MDDSHEVHLDEVPTFLEENAGEAVWVGSFVVGHFFDSSPDLLLSDGNAKSVEVVMLDVELIPVKFYVTVGSNPPHDLREVVVYDLLLLPMLSHPTVSLFDAVNMVFSSPGIDTAMEKFCVRIPFFEVGHPRTLALPSSLKDRQANDSSFKSSPKVGLGGGEETRLLSNVQPKDDQQSRMELDVGLREHFSTPFRKAEGGFSELMMKDLIGLRVGYVLVPGRLDHLSEPRQGDPNVFKFEGAGTSGSFVICQEQRTVVRQGG